MNTSTVTEIADVLDQGDIDGYYQLDRRVYTDPDLFELEMKYIFEGTWLYLAHESQLPNPYDFITTYMGRRPVIVNRNGAGELQCFINSCAHRGAKVLNGRRGNRKVFSCPYHGWCYDAHGQVIDCGESENSGYTPAFDKSNLRLHHIAKIASYRGFIFGSLNADVQPLQQHLASATKFIDLFVDQTVDGKLEVLPGAQSYTFDGNWKLQAENGVDGYHITVVHSSYMQTVARRRQKMGAADPVRPVDVTRAKSMPGGFYDFGNGHTLIWNEWPNPEVRPLFPERARLAERLGETHARWMIDYLRNLLIYPNVFLMDNMSTQIRIIRPLTVDTTEVRSVCFGPASEAPAARLRRIRQYEDFFNAAGMATPDDLEIFNESQIGFSGKYPRFSNLSRGAARLTKGPDSSAQALGIQPQYSGTLEGEGIYVGQYRRWGELLKKGAESSSNEA